MTYLFRNGLAAAALAALPLLSACEKVESPETAAGTKDDGTLTTAAVLGKEDDLATLREAMDEAELSGLLDGVASYTILAPNDAAFAALGKEGAALLEPEQRPMLVAVLRDHLLPGHLTPEAITTAIEEKGGPVSMTTLGDKEITFSNEEGAIHMSIDGSGDATIAGTATATNNGVVIPVNSVLLPPKA